MLSLKEIEYLENTISREVALRKDLIERLEIRGKNGNELQKTHIEIAIRKQKDSLDTHISIFEKLRSLGGH